MQVVHRHQYFKVTDRTQPCAGMHMALIPFGWKSLCDSLPAPITDKEGVTITRSALFYSVLRGETEGVN